LTGRRPDYGALPTESPHPRGEELDRLSTEQVVTLLLDEEVAAAQVVARAAPAIARAAERFAATLAGGGRVVYAGAGTSGRLGALDAAELVPTFGVAPGRVVAVVAGGPAALRRSVEGAEDRPAAGARAIAALEVGARDLVCGIAASGVTAFTRAALEEAARRGAGTLFVTCAPAPEQPPAAELVIALPVGPEVVAGSTRLKAGTATKLALNAISTAAMVRLGKVYRGRMIDLVATNAKLRARALRMVAELGGVDRARAAALLAEAGGRVRPALAAALLDLPVAEAAARLDAAGGQLARLARR
jgi:N-acetylmuramic acid 6-phosphate etherase